MLEGGLKCRCVIDIGRKKLAIPTVNAMDVEADSDILSIERKGFESVLTIGFGPVGITTEKAAVIGIAARDDPTTPAIEAAEAIRVADGWIGVDVAAQATHHHRRWAREVEVCVVREQRGIKGERVAGGRAPDGGAAAAGADACLVVANVAVGEAQCAAAAGGVRVGLQVADAEGGAAIEIKRAVVRHPIGVDREDVGTAAGIDRGIGEASGDADAVVGRVAGAHHKTAAEPSGIDVAHQVVRHLLGCAALGECDVLAQDSRINGEGVAAGAAAHRGGATAAGDESLVVADVAVGEAHRARAAGCVGVRLQVADGERGAAAQVEGGVIRHGIGVDRDHIRAAAGCNRGGAVAAGGDADRIVRGIAGADRQRSRGASGLNAADQVADDEVVAGVAAAEGEDGVVGQAAGIDAEVIVGDDTADAGGAVACANGANSSLIGLAAEAEAARAAERDGFNGGDVAELKISDRARIGEDQRVAAAAAIDRVGSTEPRHADIDGVGTAIALQIHIARCAGGERVR